jgi:methionyl-tRNA formyltransferase
MRIIFMGSPDFAVPSLEAVHRSRHKIITVVTQPDRPKGRGQQRAATAVKEKAIELSLPLLQPETVKDPAFYQDIVKLQPDLILVVAFSILPENVVHAPAQGCLNIHASLLPKYRGAAPIQWAIYNGESETGITYFRLDRTVDTGAMYRQVKVPIPETATGGDLYEILKQEGAKHIVEILDGIDSGILSSVPQPATGATRAPKLKKEDGRINWARSAAEICNQIRAFSPFPGTWTTWGERTITLTRARVSAAGRPKAAPPGAVLEAGRDGLTVAAGSGAVEVLELKPQNSRVLSVREFINGYQMKAGEGLGTPAG